MEEDLYKSTATDSNESNIDLLNSTKEEGGNKLANGKSGYPPTSTMRRRLAAFFVDLLLLAIFLSIFVFLLSDFFFRIGPYGRFVGWVVFLVYFGVLNSRLGGGHTLGKRIFKLSVTDKNGNKISFKRSMLRAFILSIPIIFIGWELPEFYDNYYFSFIYRLGVQGVGGALFYTVLFNRKTRQAIHDIFIGTYVVYLKNKTNSGFGLAPFIHQGLCITIIALVLTLAILNPSLNDFGRVFGIHLIEKKQKIQIRKNKMISAGEHFNFGGITLSAELTNKASKIIRIEDDQFFFIYAKPKINFHKEPDKTENSLPEKDLEELIVTAWYKGEILDENLEILKRSIGKKLILHKGLVSDYDILTINIQSICDVGVSVIYYTHSDSRNIDAWM